MEELFIELQEIFSRAWSLGAEAELDKVLESLGWSDGIAEMSWSGIQYRTRCHPELGEFKIEIEFEPIKNMRIEVSKIDQDGFTEILTVIRPTAEQLAWVYARLAELYADFDKVEDEYDFFGSDEEVSVRLWEAN